MSFTGILFWCAVGSLGGYLLNGLDLIPTVIGYLIAVSICWFVFGKRSHG